MKVSMFFLFLFFNSFVYSQNFNLSELIKINDYQMDNFDSYVTRKGYQYYNAVNDDFENSTTYTFYRNNIESAYISKFVYKTTKKVMVTFQTSNSSTYLNLKNDLRLLGFKFINTEYHDNHRWLKYQNGNLLLNLISTAQQDNFGRKLTSYEISLSRIY